MNHDDIRERDQIRKMLRRRPVDQNQPPKPTTPELMQQLTAGISGEYAAGADMRADQAKQLFTEQKERQ